jgi:beta-N-acetylhexosaminidase
VVLYGCNLAGDGDVARLAGLLRADADVLIAVDEEGGDVTRLHYRTGSRYPGNHVLGTADDPELTAAVAAGIGGRLRRAAIGLDLAPDVDVNVDPDNPVIGVRSFGADPGLVSRHATAWVGGLQSAGVAACAKHFPGHGDTRADSHRELPVVDCTEREWRAVHLPPFAAAVAAGVQSVMTAHLVVPALADEPATMSRRILADLLRGELGFDGVVVTDALDMGAITRSVGAEGGAVAALAAGADALCLGVLDARNQYLRVRAAIVEAVRSGYLPLARLADAAERVDRLRAWATAAAGAAGTAGAGASGVPPKVEPGLVAARRAAVGHRVRPLAGPPVVVELRGTPNLAVGDAAWDLGRPLAALGLAPATTVRLAKPDPATGPAPDEAVDALGVDAAGAAVDRVVAAAGAAPLVVVGRDVPRHPWQLAYWRRLLAARPDAVLVDLGLPRPDALVDGPYVLVAGAARPNLTVAAELLVHGRP